MIRLRLTPLSIYRSCRRVTSHGANTGCINQGRGVFEVIVVTLLLACGRGERGGSAFPKCQVKSSLSSVRTKHFTELHFDPFLLHSPTILDTSLAKPQTQSHP